MNGQVERGSGDLVVRAVTAIMAAVVGLAFLFGFGNVLSSGLVGCCRPPGECRFPHHLSVGSDFVDGTPTIASERTASQRLGVWSGW